RNALEVSIPLMYSSRLVDEMKYDEALKCLESLYSHKEEIMPLYVKEIACELAFLYLRTGNIGKAAALLDKDLRKYVETYRKTMSSKERLLCAVALYLDNDEAKAREIHDRLKSARESICCKVKSAVTSPLWRTCWTIHLFHMRADGHRKIKHHPDTLLPYVNT
ncbi:MAG: hypothetical protein K2H71_08200, partial [Muribaculaceae bacterium]|nr:hypothetical protein [Muribaculaceae bacterium]